MVGHHSFCNHYLMISILSYIVTDRLAYLNFVNGSLASSLSVKLDRSRASLKALRDLETSITPRRNIRAGLRLQISRLEHEQQKGAERKLADLRDQLKKAEADDQPAEREIEIMKRKAVRESEQHKWDALREVCFFYGYLSILLNYLSPVWRETCAFISSCNSHHCSASSHPALAHDTVYRWKEHRSHSCLPSACSRQLQDRPYQFASSSGRV